jgi:hypothetical protein
VLRAYSPSTQASPAQLDAMDIGLGRLSAAAARALGADRLSLRLSGWHLLVHGPAISTEAPLSEVALNFSLGE